MSLWGKRISGLLLIPSRYSVVWPCCSTSCVYPVFSVCVQESLSSFFCEVYCHLEDNRHERQAVTEGKMEYLMREQGASPVIYHFSLSTHSSTPILRTFRGQWVQSQHRLNAPLLSLIIWMFCGSHSFLKCVFFLVTPTGWGKVTLCSKMCMFLRQIRSETSEHSGKESL